MIIYDLTCEFEHEFEGWFKNSEDMLEQRRNGFLTCPFCDSGNITKKLAAPNVSRKSNAQSGKPTAETSDLNLTSKNMAIGNSSARKFTELQKMLGKVHDYIDANFQDVGNRFTEEAIGMQRGEKEVQNIKGTVNREQMKELAEEGVSALPLPPKPIDKKKIN